jgi:hypothetical protein
LVTGRADHRKKSHLQKKPSTLGGSSPTRPLLLKVHHLFILIHLNPWGTSHICKLAATISRCLILITKLSSGCEDKGEHIDKVPEAYALMGRADSKRVKHQTKNTIPGGDKNPKKNRRRARTSKDLGGHCSQP